MADFWRLMGWSDEDPPKLQVREVKESSAILAAER